MGGVRLNNTLSVDNIFIDRECIIQSRVGAHIPEREVTLLLLAVTALKFEENIFVEWKFYLILD